jgi:hypothetical protein
MCKVASLRLWFLISFMLLLKWFTHVIVVDNVGNMEIRY